MDTDSDSIIASRRADLLARNNEKTRRPSGGENWDDDERALLEELRTPLEQVTKKTMAMFRGDEKEAESA